MAHRPMLIPPKTAAQLAERAKRMDGCVKYGSSAWQFAQGLSVATLVSLEPATGYVMKDPLRADEIRSELAHQSATS